MSHVVTMAEDAKPDPDPTTKGYTRVGQKDPETGGYWPGDLVKDAATGAYVIPG